MTDRDARNDRRSRESLLEILALSASVELENAQAEAAELGRKEKEVIGRFAAGGDGSVCGKRPRLAEPRPPSTCGQARGETAVEQTRTEGEGGTPGETQRGPRGSAGAVVVSDPGNGRGKAKAEGKGKRRSSCLGGVAESEEEPRYPTVTGLPAPPGRLPAATTSSPSSEDPQQQQQRDGVPAAKSPLQRDEESAPTHQQPSLPPPSPPLPQEVAPPHQERAMSDAAVAAMLGEHLPGSSQQQHYYHQLQEQSQSFCPTALALQRQEWERGSPAAAAAAPAASVAPATFPSAQGRRRRRSSPEQQQQQQQQQQQPTFVVMGLVGEHAGDRALLLPSREWRETMAAVPGARVPVPWTDTRGVQHTMFLTQTKAKPVVANPLLMLATLLTWVGELSPEVLPEKRRVLLPECLLQGGSRNSSGSYGTNRGITGSSGRGDPGSVELSLGAAWLLAHLLFGRDAGGVVRQIFTARSPPKGKVQVRGGEALALNLASCPLIGWCPRPEDVMQAMSDGRGNLEAYSVSPTEFDVDIGIGVGNGATRAGGLAAEGEAAADELVRAGLGKIDGGLLTLAPKMEETAELVLDLFIPKTWDPHREVMARVALGLLKTGPMATGMCPPAMPALFDAMQGRTPSPTSDDGGGVDEDDVVCLDDRGVGGGSGGRMHGVVGEVCVELHKCFTKAVRGGIVMSEGQDSFLNQVCKKEYDSRDSPLVWSGPMAKALALLGGSTSVRRSSNVGGTAVDDGDDAWMASLSREDRLMEAASLRLKTAAYHVAQVVEALVDAIEKLKEYPTAARLLRLLVRRDQGAAGPEYSNAPDLGWAADWVTTNLRGPAYARLIIDLKHVHASGRRQLEAAKDACEDEDVSGGERVDLTKRRDALQRQFGDSQDTPGREKPFRHEEEVLVVAMKSEKKGDAKSDKGGRKLYFDKPEIGQQRSRSAKLEVEEVLIRHKYRSGGWLGVHCEYSLIQLLFTLLLWEELFDPRVSAAVPHCLTNRPADMKDKFFLARRRGKIRGRLSEIFQATDEVLWNDVGRRFDRYEGTRAVWCDWQVFPKEQVMQIAVAFGGRRLSTLLRTIIHNAHHMRCGFPDVVLWRPKGIGATAGEENGLGSGWDTKRYFDYDWRGLGGRGWEVEVVEVKSKGDITSNVQKAWLMELQNAGVRAMVTRVLTDEEDEERARPRCKRGAARVQKPKAGAAAAVGLEGGGRLRQPLGN
eukprot:g10786.t1